MSKKLWKLKEQESLRRINNKQNLDSYFTHIEPVKTDAKNFSAGLMKKLLKTRRPSKVTKSSTIPLEEIQLGEQK